MRDRHTTRGEDGGRGRRSCQNKNNKTARVITVTYGSRTTNPPRARAIVVFSLVLQLPLNRLPLHVCCSPLVLVGVKAFGIDDLRNGAVPHSQVTLNTCVCFPFALHR